MKSRTLLFSIVLCATFANCFGANIIDITGQKALDDALAANKENTVNIKLFSLSCGHCKRLNEEAKPQGTVLAVDLGKKENQAIAQKYKVHALPTVITISADGSTKTHLGYIEAKNALEAK